MILANSRRVRRRVKVAIGAVIFTALAMASSVPAWAASKDPAASTAADSSRDQNAASRKNKNDVGIKGHGFVRDGDVFTTIDAPGADLYTVAFGIDDRGRTVGGYVDEKGKLHGFLKDKEAFTVIDFPGAAATFAARINAEGQIVGAYGADDPNLPTLELPRGFLLDKGVFTKIDFPGAVRTQPFGINTLGQIVGEYVDAEGRYHGFLLDQGVFTTLDAPGGTATFAYDIDDSGRIVGFSRDASGTFHGFLRDGSGTFTPIDVPGAERGTLPTGINNRGQIVGLSQMLVNESVVTRAFVLENGAFATVEVPEAMVSASTLIFDTNDRGQLAGVYDLVGNGYLRERPDDFTVFGSPEGNINEVVGINNRGQIVGRFVDANGTNRGFLRDTRGFTPIDFPGATSTATYKINDRGQIVGGYSTVGNNTAYPTHGYLLDQGVFTTIDVPGAQHTIALDINNSGQIVGEYQDASGMFHGFMRDSSGAFTTVDVPAATRTLITGINDRGQAVGVYADAEGTTHAFLFEDGRVTTIDVPGALFTQPYAVNNRGQIVGISFDGVRFRGFLLSDGTFTRITGPGAFFFGSFVTDIDDRGRIAGASF
jgi:probable HAF family extracellular repeat protein